MYLYKMMKFNSYNLDALSKKSVFFCHPSQFNDPLDADLTPKNWTIQNLTLC